MADHEKQVVEEMCRALCAAAVGKPGYEHAMAWDDWDEESREIGRTVMTAAYRAIPAAPDPRDQVIRGLVEAVLANRDLCQKMCEAYDKEDAALRGEPNPWMLDDPGDIGDSENWQLERIGCLRAALNVLKMEYGK